MNRNTLSVMLLALILTPFGYAQDGGEDQRTGLYHLRYGYRAWNLDPAAIDSASILMRDKNTGRLVQIMLQETAPDSSIFSGIFSIRWDDAAQLATEFYIPPQNLLDEKEGFRELQRIVLAGELKPKPFILRLSEVGDHVIEIFDTAEQAAQARALFEEEMRLRDFATNVMRRSGEGLEGVHADEHFLKRALSVEEQRKLSQLRAEVLRQEQLERQARIERLSAYRMLPAATRRSQAEKAKALGAEGLAFFHQNNIEEAALKFEQSRKLDPSLSDYDFQYGASLYRLERYVASLAILRMVHHDKVPADELWYYLGLNYYQMNDLIAARESFEKVSGLKSSKLAPSATFYVALVNLRLLNLDAARAGFQAVTETTQEASLKERSREYLVYTDRLETYHKTRNKKWSLAGALGGIYDSNVLLTSDSLRDLGLATDSEALRSLVQVEAGYRPHYTEKTEWAARLGFLNLYSMEPGLASSADLQKADPTIFTVTAPYTIKGKWGQRPSRWEITPGYETILMNLDGTGTKTILNSATLDLSASVVMREDWISSYHLKLRHDDSHVATADPATNADAFKVELKYSNIYYTQRTRGSFLLPEVGYIYNAAEGEEQTYYRINLSLAYIFPWIWGAHWNLQGSYFLATYPDGVPDPVEETTSSRSEQNAALGLGFTKPLGKSWTWSVHTSYTRNTASESSYSYSKWNALTSFGFSY